MTKKLAVAIIHGIGSQERDFADDLVEELNDRIQGSEQIAWESIFWADVLKARQESYLRRANAQNDLDYIALRRFVISALSDGSAYRRVGNDPLTTYGQIHTVVRDAIRELFEDENKLGSNPRPLVVLAHSLGGHIMSNYIWDIQKKRPIVPPGDNKFERMQTLRGFITFGCNIPLFTFALAKVVPIKLPAGASWVNYYDPDDILGYPLKPLGPKYRETVSRDVCINVGGVFSSWNPLSHNGYWTDNDFTKPVARFISRML